MAVASGPPMKIGRTRRSPSASRSMTIGAFVGSSTPMSSISIIDADSSETGRNRRRPPPPPRVESAGRQAYEGPRKERTS